MLQNEPQCVCLVGSALQSLLTLPLPPGRWLQRLVVVLALPPLRSRRCQCLRSVLAAPARFGSTASLLRSTPQTLLKSPASAQPERATQQCAVWLRSCSRANRWRSTCVMFNSTSALTLPSSGRARAGRATLVRLFSLRAASPRPPLMSNVRRQSSVSINTREFFNDSNMRLRASFDHGKRLACDAWRLPLHKLQAPYWQCFRHLSLL